MKRLLSLIAISTLAACSNQTTTISAEVLQGEWQISHIEGFSVLADKTPSMRFEGQEVFIRSGCNNMMGIYTLAANNIDFSRLAATKMFCAGPEMQQEDAISKVLNNQSLVIQDKNGQLVLMTNKQVQMILQKAQ